MQFSEFMDEQKKAGRNLIQTSRTLIDKDTKCIAALFYNDSPESQDVMLSNGIVIYFTGNKTKSGNPSLNQLWQNQSAYQQSKLIGNTFPVFYKTNVMIGEYKIDCIYKIVAPNGCTYFSIKLVRKVRNKNLF